VPNTPTLVDTHCHIHESSYPMDAVEVLKRAHDNGVTKLICVGTSEQSSKEAIEFASTHSSVYATVGVHPHDTKDGYAEIVRLVRAQDVIAIGEIGLDYFYTHSPREVQIRALETQLQIAADHDLPVSFHVREAFDDFWPILRNFPGTRGVLHSFTDSMANMERGLSLGLYVAVNGISTFTKDENQKAMFMSMPLDRLLLETDSPFLTPKPFRGKMNEPGLVKEVAQCYADARDIEYDVLAHQTTVNADKLFRLT
jgi:TatD DNase family protein